MREREREREEGGCNNMQKTIGQGKKKDNLSCLLLCKS